MNRKNIWIHITIAVVVITFAAILGQIRRWENSLERYNIVSKTAPKPVSVSRVKNDTDHEVLVKFRSGVSLADIKKLVTKNNDAIEDKYENFKGLTVIDDLDGLNSEQVAAQYRQMTSLVEYAEPNAVIKLDPSEKLNGESDHLDYKFTDSKVPNDPMFAEQWSLNNDGKNGGKDKADIRAIDAWKKTKGSRDVVVAVLDSGVDYTHSDLAANIWTRPANLPAYTDDELGTFNDLHGFNATDNLADPMDDNGHGTHCAGIIGAEGDNNEGIAGINWNVQIMPLKFMGRGGFGTTKDAIEAINYAVQRKKDGVNVRVINASWGSTASSKALEDAIRAAGEQGILFVAAAGNDGSSNDKRPHYPSNYDLPNVISVAALDRTDNLTSFSNYGVKTVHIGAPGKDIPSTWLNGSFREASGTSMAAPHVAGVAALIVAANPNITVEKLRERILNSVDKLDSLSGKVESGGKLDAAKALGE